MHRFRRIAMALAAIGCITLLPGGSLLAQQDQSQEQTQGDVTQGDVDPPSRVARLSYAEGSVSLQPAGVDDWTVPAINRPLTTGDQLWSDRGSRAEIELGSAAVRLGDSSGVALLNLSDEAVQLRVSAGSVNVTLRGLDPAGSFEIDAPNAAISLQQPGEYSIRVDGAGNTSVTPRDGAAEVTASDGQTATLQPGQRGEFAANGASDIVPVGPADDFDRWCDQRDQRWARNAAATQYVSSDAVGYEDLSDYGEWREEPDYGYVWFPTQVADDWAPYRYGHWLWIAPWGWTWVDDAPWGFAPFHYGRWSYLDRRWCWVPAPPHARAVYAPALVAWIGGPRVGVSLTVGGGPGVGWLPLAPGEVYVPGYRVSPRYVRNINVSNTVLVNTTYITNIYHNPSLQNRYANRIAPRAVTVVPQNTFASGEPVARHVAPASPQWQSASVQSRPPGIVPGRQSVLGPAAVAHLPRPPQTLIDRPVLARRPPPPTPASFERQQAQLRSSGGQPLPAEQLMRLRGTDSYRPKVIVVPGLPRVAAPGSVPSPARAPALAPAPAPVPVPAPIDRRVIPERSPQFLSPSRVPQAQQPQGPQRPSADDAQAQAATRAAEQNRAREIQQQLDQQRSQQQLRQQQQQSDQQQREQQLRQQQLELQQRQQQQQQLELQQREQQQREEQLQQQQMRQQQELQLQQQRQLEQQRVAPPQVQVPQAQAPLQPQPPQRAPEAHSQPPQPQPEQRKVEPPDRRWRGQDPQ